MSQPTNSGKQLDAFSQEEKPVTYQTSTIRQLASMYKVHPVTMKRWLEKLKIKPKMGGNLFTPSEVEEIVKKLGKC